MAVLSFLRRILPVSLADREIPTDKQIESFIHCPLCIAECPQNRTAEDWSQLDVGWTDVGLQVWCRRHRQNVLHIDFLDHKLPIAGTGDAAQVDLVYLSPSRPSGSIGET
jgi:hypothetical protein